MKSDYNIFLLWNKVLDRENDIKDLISKKFEIIKKFEFEWSHKYFNQNLSRFYGKKLSSSFSKAKYCGMGCFVVYLVKDKTPIITDAGNNQNIIAMKKELREFLGGNFIHASDNQSEAEENLYFLLGKSLHRILADPKPKKVKPLKQDVIGTPTWLDEDRMRKALKRVPNAIWNKEQNIITCSDVKFACRVLNARKVIWPWSKDKYKINIRGRDKIFEIKMA